MIQSGIYKITNLINGKFYIGSSYNYYNRKREHLSKLRRNTHTNSKLQNAFNKYKEYAFYFCLIEECEREKLIEREQYYIDTLKPEFNICLTAGTPVGGMKGRHHTEESKIKNSNSHKGKPSPNKGKSPSEETRKKMSESGKLKKLSEEHKRKIGLSGLGRKMPPKTPETLLKMSESHKGHKPSFKSIRKGAESRRGYKHSHESIQKRLDTKIKNGTLKRTEEQKQNMRKPKSEEHKQKLKKPKSEQAKKNMSIAKLGKHWSEKRRLAFINNKVA